MPKFKVTVRIPRLSWEGCKPYWQTEDHVVQAENPDEAKNIVLENVHRRFTEYHGEIWNCKEITD